ncbi:MAG: 3-dehydroquinate synthase [Oscillospiraceae bacterium]|nr:3-dehydroquinate synthase [Oscillospiraceae bacterium]
MNIIPVKTGRPYEIRIEKGLLAQTGALLRPQFRGQNLAVISDSRVAELYLKPLLDSLEAAGFGRPATFSVPQGEESKSLQMTSILYNFLAERHIRRSDCLIALGGGVVGDLTGFVASTFCRGMSFVQVPTTLLAQIDSSVGGKTAVNLPAGKNMVGTFWQPSLVVCDPDTLDTLPEDIFAAGVAEALKYGMIRDEKLFDLLALDGAREHIEEVISRCVTIKREIVQNDERDTGERMLLNFGHTLGHGVESGSHYALSHGFSVAIGMNMIVKASVARGLTAPSVLERLEKGCRRYGLPTFYDGDLERVLEICRSDKKSEAGSLKAILLHSLGDGYIQPFSFEEFESFVREGLE